MERTQGGGYYGKNEEQKQPRKTSQNITKEKERENFTSENMELRAPRNR